MKNIQITEIDKIDENMMNLLLLEAKAVDDYIERESCYSIKNKEDIVGICTLLPTRPFAIELVNISIKNEYQNKRYGKNEIRTYLISFANRRESANE